MATRQSHGLAVLIAVCVILLHGTAHIAVGEDRGGGSFKVVHHHCVHEEKAQRFEETIDMDSLVTPQIVTPFETPGERELSTFLDVVGSKESQHTNMASRSLAASAASASFQPIRIAFDLSKLTSDPGYMCKEENQVVEVDGAAYTCTNGDVLTADKRDFIVSVLLKAIEDYFEDILSVQRVVGNLIVKGIGCSSGDDWACCSTSIPQYYKTQGVADADYLLHVTARPTTGATIAWALPCNLDQYGRPISGQANFGPGRIDPATAAARTEQIGTALHEMTHALVFSKGRFYDFRQPLNGDKWGYSNVVSQSQGSGGIWVSKIVTPSVARQAKQHFNCFDWVNAGLELENGDSGSADFSSHWEKRLMMNEYMTATSSYDPVYSAMTLALFEDSGWYQVSYKNAQVLPWGYMEWCGVAQGKCSTWSSRYICSDGAQTGCTADYTSKGYCNVASYQSSIPAGFQYFKDPRVGGRDTYADYCPFYRAYSNGDCRNIGRSATLVNTNNYMEEVGPTSKCFQSTLRKSGSDDTALRSACFKVVGCTSKYLRLSVGGNDVLCPMEGGNVTLTGYKGVIVCPVANRLCQMLQDKCSGNGILQPSGTCQCNPGFVGNDCSGIACPTSTTNGQECGGSSQGTCDYATGRCVCRAAYTGLMCSELVCPAIDGGKNASECSGHGSCDRVYGQCKCQDGYSGKACECVPGCTSASCGSTGSCDCTTGGCSCKAGYSGPTCSNAFDAPISELNENTGTISDTVPNKMYRFYKISLTSSTYDITFSVQYANNNGKGVDVDLYGSFVDLYPTSLSSKSTLFVSDYGLGNRDEINLCGSLGVFPRGLNDSFRYCARPTSSYVLETPGVFYVSVFGFVGGAFNLSVITDKCRNVTCSDHGSCGVNYPGVCTCDRYWTGDDCSVPKCGPDCQDLGTCSANTPRLLVQSGNTNENSGNAGDTNAVNVNYATTTSASIQTTSECFGNGVCRAAKDSKGRATPQCVCDDAFTFVDPTPAQALCKELLPSVASVQRYTEPFIFSTTKMGQSLKINAWSLFTIRVRDEWQVLVANLQVESTETDAMLFIRKEKLPTAVLYGGPSSESSSFVQFTDSDGWTSGSPVRKVVITRATSTLASGLYYIGVLNSAYARASLMYTLTVNATSNCSAPGNSYGICANGSTCNVLSSQICSCPSGFVGKYCDLRATRTALAPSTSSAINSSFNDSTSMLPKSMSSYVAYRSPLPNMLDIGQWAYYSFDIEDTSVQLAQFRLLIDNALDIQTPVLPLLLVRGPLDDGFPTLFTESLQDFHSISQRNTVQSVTIAVDRLCSFSATSKDCYKVGIFNRNYSGEPLQYHLEVELFKSPSAIFPSSTCGSNGNKVNCNGNGKCLTIGDSDNSTKMSPTCQCNTGWTGLQCNSPKSFDLPQLWSAINNVSLICTTCNSSFTLARGEVKMFRVPVSLRANSGLLIRVVPVTSINISTMDVTSGPNPNIYVSETLPRSLYDFTHISSSNGSSSGGQVVRLTNESLTGIFWVVVFSDYPASGGVQITSSMGGGGRTRARRLSSASSTTSTSFRLEAHVYDLDGTTDDSLLTDKAFAHVVFGWLFKTPVGIAVFVFSLVFVVLVVCFCLWRLCNAPENQDKVTRRFFGSADRGTATHYPDGFALSRVGVSAHVRDVEQGARFASSTLHT